jgi:hypothetical protein
LVAWVDKALDHSITKQNMKFGFNICGIRSLNPKTMEHKISLLDIYITITRKDNEEVEEDYNSNEKIKRNQQ